MLGLRSGLQAFANLRPAVVLEQLADASSLKPEVVKGVDIMIVRELVGDIYFGQPRVGIPAVLVAPLLTTCCQVADAGWQGLSTASLQGFREEGGERIGYNTMLYSESEVRASASNVTSQCSKCAAR